MKISQSSKTKQNLEQLSSEKDQYQAELDLAHTEIQAFGDMQKQLSILQTQTKIYISNIKQRNTSISKAKETINNLLDKSNQIHDLEIELGSAADAIEQSNAPSPEQQNRTLKIQELDSEVNHIKRTNSQLLEEMMELRKKVDFLRDNDGTTACPLCGQPLDDDGCQHLAEKYESEGLEKGSTYRMNETSIQKLVLASDNIKKDVDQEETEQINLRKEARVRYEYLVGLAEEAKASQKALPDLISALENDEQSLKTTTDELTDTTEQIVSLEESITQFSSIKNRQNKIMDILRTLSDQQNIANQKLGAVQNTLVKYAVLEEGLEEKERLFAKESHDKGIYDQLSTAFGKAGVQALIIEQAIPQLEEYANDLLGRITDYRMGLKIETQRESRSGGNPRETLDINISDELGNRSYETYSGGEAFRINFALRIALSRLLAYRSGAPLPTLFIDEGFGTQDSSGLQKLVEAIQTIQADFEKILVITHIDELKEAFPTRIEVTKTSNGSTFQVV